MLSRTAWLVLAAAVAAPVGLRADAPPERPASQSAANARDTGGGEAPEDGPRAAETPPPPSQGTRVLTLKEKNCRQRQGCTDPAAPCRPCDR